MKTERAEKRASGSGKNLGRLFFRFQVEVRAAQCRHCERQTKIVVSAKVFEGVDELGSRNDGQHIIPGFEIEQGFGLFKHREAAQTLNFLHQQQD